MFFCLIIIKTLGTDASGSSGPGVQVMSILFSFLLKLCEHAICDVVIIILRSKVPSVHTMPTRFHGRTQKFTEVRCSMVHCFHNS